MKRTSLLNMAIVFFAIILMTACNGKEPQKTEKVKTPVISPEGGVYGDDVEISISCETEGATIYYSTDGSNPIEGDNYQELYLEPFKINKTTTVKAAATKDGVLSPSDVATETYTIDKIVDIPTISHESGSYDDAITVSISCSTEDANIYYTLDGSEPNALTSELYTTPITIKQSCTLKAKGFKLGYNGSETATAEYIIESTIYGSLSLTYNDETLQYNVVDYEKITNNGNFHINFYTEDENIGMTLNFRGEKLPIGTIEFSPHNSSCTGIFSENNSNYVISEGSVTINNLEDNIYTIIIKKACINTTNTIPPVKKTLNFEFKGEII